MTRIRTIACSAAAAALNALLAPGGAAAAAACDLSSGVLDVTLSASGDAVSLEAEIGGVEINVADQFDNTVTCLGATPTVSNTNAISVHNSPGLANNDVRILGASRFAPGLDSVGENGGAPEIEIFVNLNDAAGSTLTIFEEGILAFGTGGINPNADAEEVAADADIFPNDVAVLKGVGGSGPDLLSAAGGLGTGGPLPDNVELQGQDGADTLIGGNGPDVLEGGLGSDVIEAGRASDLLHGGAGSDDLDGQEGPDAVAAGPNGDMGVERLNGGAGDDGLLPSGEEDIVLGGAGLDTADYSLFAPPGVTIDLRDPRVDTEHLVGTGSADVLNGDEGPNRIYGLGGNDLLDGGGSTDMLAGEQGNDSLNVRDGEADSADCGEGRDEVMADPPGLDMLSGCEVVLFSATGDGGQGGAPAAGGATGRANDGDPTPRLTGFRLLPALFVAASSGPSFGPARGKRPARTGTTVLYRLSERAVVTFAVERVRAVRRGGQRRCRDRAERGGCTVHRRLPGRFRHVGRVGENSFRFTGRLRGRALHPGRYRLLATATDAAGNRSQIRRAAFRIVAD